MRKSRFLTRFASGALVVAVVVGAALLTGGVAGAAPPAGSLGSLTITPATGSDLTIPVARISAPCPATASGAYMQIIGPVGAADPIFPPDDPFTIVTTTTAEFSTTNAFDLSFSVSLKDAAGRDELQTGEYLVTAHCVDEQTLEEFGTFTGAMFFTSPTAYQTSDPNAGPTATTTTVDVTPASPAAAGIVKWLTAMVSPLEAAGSVQFKTGNNNIGRPVAVSGGTASTKTRLVVGTHPLTAVFTPTDANAFSGSTSNTVTYVVNAPTGSKATITSLVGSSLAFQGLPVVLFANVAPSGAAGTVQFKDGTTAIGAPVPVVGGTAIIITTELMKGVHSLTAVFTPTNPAAFGPSTSPLVSLEVQSILQ